MVLTGSAHKFGHIQLEEGCTPLDELCCCELVTVRSGASSEYIDVGEVPPSANIAMDHDETDAIR